MRAFFVIAACLWSLTATRDRLLRNYLRVLLAATLAEDVLAYGMGTGHPMYLWCYAGLSLLIVIPMLKLAASASRIMGKNLLRITVVSALLQAWLGTGAVGFSLQKVYGYLPFALGVMLLQAAIVSIAGILMLVSAPHGTKPGYITLGTMWVAQALVFYLYAAGIVQNYDTWVQLGSWLPAVVVTVGLVKVGFDVRLNGTSAPLKLAAKNG